MAADKTSFGYILSLQMAENVFMGGVMVTDSYGMPLEFRYTEPVRATKIQRVLYGDVLERYILGDVIAGNLMGHLEQRPTIFVVSDPILLSAVESEGKKGALLTASRAPSLKEIGAQQDAAEGEFFLQLTESGSPIKVKTQQDGPDSRTNLVQILCELARTMDVLEPLIRVETAIKLLWEEAPEASAAV